MTQDGGTGSSHVVVDMQEEEEEEAAPSCAVCTEPMEWVAVCRPCGHRTICAACAARIRFFEGDRRCCICRAYCPTVFVTKATTRGSQQEGFLWLPPPSLWRPSFGRQERWYYHAGMRAYFDNLRQYEEMSKVCADLSVCLDVGARSQQPAGSLNVNLRAAQQPADDQEECSCVGTFLCYVAAIQALLTFFGTVFVVAEHPYQKVLAVLAFVVLSSGFTVCTVYIWRKFSRHRPNGDQG